MTFPTVRSARLAYPPPVPNGALPDAGGRTPAEHAYRTQRAVADLYTRWRAAHSPDIAPEVLKDNAGAFSGCDAALTLPDALAPVVADAEAAKQKGDNLINKTRVGDDVTAKLEAQSYWHRKERVLDSIKETPKVVQAARDLIAHADDLQIRCLAEELGDYLASRSMPTNWISAALAARIPGLADAQADAIVKARQRDILQANHDKLTHAFQADICAPPLLDPADVTADPYTGG